MAAALRWLLQASGSRVVLVSSTDARGGQLSRQTTREQLLNPVPYDGLQVYRNTSRANLLLAQELHRRCATAGAPSPSIRAPARPISSLGNSSRRVAVCSPA